MQSDEAPCVDLSLDYNILVSGCDRANAGIWNLQDGQKTGLLEGHRQALTGVQILPEKSVCSFQISAPLIITSSLDGSLRLWSGKYHVCLAFLKGHRDLVRTIDCTSTRYVYSTLTPLLSKIDSKQGLIWKVIIRTIFNTLIYFYCQISQNLKLPLSISLDG